MISQHQQTFLRLRRLTLFLAFCGMTCWLSQLWAEQAPRLQTSVFALQGATLVPGAGQPPIQATLVIRQGLIEAMGPDVQPPPDAEIIQAKDLWIYPGFMDGANSWGIDFNLRRSETGPSEPFDYGSEALVATKSDNRKGITPEFDVGTALQADDEAANPWRKQGLVLRVASPEGGLFAGQSVVQVLSGRAPRQTILRGPAAQHMAFRMPPGAGYPSTLMGIMAHARQVLIDANHHTRRKAAFESGQFSARPPLDPALDTLQLVLAGQMAVVIEADTKDEIHRALDFAKEHHLRPILLGGAEAWRAVDRLKAEQVPVILKLNLPEQPRPPQRRRFQPFVPTSPAPPPEEPAKLTELPKRAQAELQRKHDEEWRNAAVLAEHGVRFAFSCQGLAADKFWPTVRKLIDKGLPADKALQALTQAPSEFFNVANQAGRLAPGRPAHLVVMSGPFEKASSAVRFVFADGVRFDYSTPSSGPSTDKDKAPAPKPTEKKEAAVPPTTTASDQPPEKESSTEKKQAAGKPDEGQADAPPEQPTEIEADRVPKTRTGGSVLLQGATLITLAEPGTIKADLLIENGKITAIGPDLLAPIGVKVVRLDGLYIMPGIIDTHSHFSMSGGVNEATLSVVPEVRVRDIVNSDDPQIYKALAGGVTTARLLHGSANCIGGQDAVIKMKWGATAHEMVLHDAPRGIKFALGENVKRSAGRFPNTRLGVEAVLVRAFTEAQAYRQEWQDYHKAKASNPNLLEPRRDLRLEALVDILEGRLFIHCHCYRADEILMLLRVADRFGFKIKSLQHGLEGYKVAPEIAIHGASLSSFADWWAYKIEAYDAIPYNAALLTEAGVLTVLKSDSNELMRHLYQEAAKTMKYGGLSETDALKMITLNAAKQLGLDKRLGSLEIGKDADLAIFNAHPLNSYARCEMTLVDGEVYFERADRGPTKNLPPMEMPKARGPELNYLKIAKNPKGKYLIRHATIHPVIGPAVRGDELLIENGKISALGPKLDVPEDAVIIDAKGLHLYPGMVDAGTILGLTEIDSARETKDYADSGDFQPDLRAAIGINPDSELIPVTRSNGVLAVVSRPTGSILPGQSVLVHLHGWTIEDMVIRDPLALHLDLPPRIPVFSGSPNAPPMARAIARKQRDEKIRKLKDMFKQALLYEQAKLNKSLNRPIDPRLEALLPYAKGEKPVMILAERAEDILEAIKLADELHIKMVLNGGLESWKVAKELKHRQIPVILGPVMTMPQENYDPYDATFACAAKLHEAGVKFCIRSEGGPNSRNLPYEAAMAVSYGLPWEEALKAVTLYPSEILGVADHFGSIEVGKQANLVFTDGDLLQATTQVRGLLINGQPIEPVDKQTRLYERYRERLKEQRNSRSLSDPQR